MTMNLEQIISSYPYNTRRKVFISLSRLLEKVEGDTEGAKINRIEKDLTRFTVKVWNKRATKAVNSAVNGIKGSPTARFTKKDEAKVFKAIEKAYNGIEKEVGPKIKRATGQIYKTSQKRFAAQNKKKLKSVRKVGEDAAITGVAFDLETTAVVNQMSKLHAVSIGDHYPKTLKPTITNSIQRGVFEKGLNKAQAGEFLKKELSRKLGGKAFVESVPPGIRAQGINSVNAYHEGLSATNVTLTRNMSNIQLMNEGGVTQVEVVAVMDNRTSTICQQMDGRIFTIEQVNKYAKQVMEADSVADLQEFGKWQRDLSGFGLKEGQKLTDSDASARLAEAGVLVPPYHFRCRTELHIA